MGESGKEEDDKTYDLQFGVVRLILLILQLIAILINLQDQTRDIMFAFPETSADHLQITKSFKAANTMALVFTVMQLIILYVGTNRFRVKSTIFIASIHLIGIWLYFSQGRWQYENIWNIFSFASFVPTISEIAIAIYTAKV